MVRSPGSTKKEPLQAVEPVRVLLSYAEEDAALVRGLRAHLRVIEQDGHVQITATSEAPLGEDLRSWIKASIREADVFVACVSADYLTTQIDVLQDALSRSSLGLRVIPIYLRPARLPPALQAFQGLPSGERPVTLWENRDEAWVDIVAALSSLVRSIAFEQAKSEIKSRLKGSAPRLDPFAMHQVARGAAVESESSRAPERHCLEDIFPIVGDPTLNFVEPSQLPEIRRHLRLVRGGGVVIEGPSGSGKTTAVRKVLKEEHGDTPLIWLTGSLQRDLAALDRVVYDQLPEGGYLVVDDAHRLDEKRQTELASLMKSLGDQNRRDAKMVVIGVNEAGLSLVRRFPDIGGRFPTVSMGRQPIEKIEELIRKGEVAANVLFRNRAEFAITAAGSLFIAQLLCHEALRFENVTETLASERELLVGPMGQIMERVIVRLSRIFHEDLLKFAAYDEAPPPRGATLALLWMMAQEEEAWVSLTRARARFAELAPRFDWLGKSHMSKLFESHPRLKEHFFYNRDAAVLSAEDPRLFFYLKHLRWEPFARDTGHTGVREDPEKGLLFDVPPATSAMATPFLPIRAPDPLPRSCILHLSDCHFGTNKDAMLWSNQLLQDLRLDLGIGIIDALVVSGDLTNTASSSEFEAARVFLSLLRAELGLLPSQLIVVPGNHDLSWQTSKDAYTPTRREDHRGRLEEGQFIDAGAYIEVRNQARYRERFSNFADFYHKMRIEAYPLDEERQATLHHFEKARLVFLGLNSAWEVDHHHRSRASIQGVALGEALRLMRNTNAYENCLRIAVWHHPLHSSGEDRIKDTGFIELLAQSDFRLALHGHVHEAGIEQLRYDLSAIGRGVHLSAAGTFGALTALSPGVPLQYQVIEIEGKKAKVHTRRREKPGGAWKPDARWLVGDGRSASASYEIELF